MRRTFLAVVMMLAVLFTGRMLHGQSQLKRLNDELVQIAGKLTPSVVEIEVGGRLIKSVIRRKGGDDQDMQRVNIRITRGHAGIQARVHGSGVIMTDDGFILTADDFFRGRGESKMKVKLADGRVFGGKLVGRDRRTGLAVVKIEAQGLPAVALAEKIPPVGSLVVAVGNTAGVGRSVSLGLVSGTNRVVAGEGPALVGSSKQYTGLLQVTNPVSPSDVGGLVADLDGKMVGMLHSSLTGRPRMPQPFKGHGMVDVRVFGLGPVGPQTVQGVSFATPQEVIRRVFEPLKRGEEVKWGYLGIYFAVAPKEGIRVRDLVGDGPAAEAGVRKGDLLRSVTIAGRETLKFRGNPVEGALLARMIGWTRPGTEVTLGLARDGAEQQVKIKLGAAPEMPEQEAMVFDPDVKFHIDGPMRLMKGRAWLGIRLEEAEGGVRVAAVIPASPAARHDLRAGDVITRIGDEEMRTPEEVTRAVEKHKPGERISVALRRGDGKIVADVELGRRAAPPFNVEAFRGFGRARLGVEAEDSEEGPKITRVLKGSSAEKAGLKVGDVVIRADEKDLAGVGDLREVVRRHKPGDEITVTVRRGGDEIDLKVKLGGREPRRRIQMP